MSQKPWKLNAQWGHARQFWTLTAMLIYTITAINSRGFYHFDEHFQILEFANSKITHFTGNLPWEYNAQLRPWLQPWMTFVEIQFLELLQITSPFIQSTFLRIFSSFITLICVWRFTRILPIWFKERAWQNFSCAVSYLTCFLPMLHARASSENLSGSILLLSLAHVAEGKNPFFIGLWGSMAFEFRYQSIFIFAGIAAYYLFFKLRSAKEFLLLSLGSILPILMGLIFDSWGYGQLSFPAWNYFRVNLLEGKAAQFGSEGPFYYFAILAQSIPPIGFLFVTSVVAAMIFLRKHLLAWSVLPFVLVHILISHKELRFLFPVAHQSLLLIIAFFYRYRNSQFWLSISEKIHSDHLKTAFYLAISVNFILLAVQSLKSRWPDLATLEYIDEFTPKNSAIKFENGADPRYAGGLPMNFYVRSDLVFADSESFGNFLNAINRDYFYYKKTKGYTDSKSYRPDNCKVIFESPSYSFLPEAITKSFIFSYLDRNRYYQTILKCKTI